MKNSIKKTLLSFIIDKFIKKMVFRFLPDRQFIICTYFINIKQLPHLNNPKAYNEKLQWIKIYGGLEKYYKYADKLMVRDFIKKTIGRKYLIPLIGTWDKFEDIPFNNLPRQFVLKATHGSAYNFICKDKKTLNINSLREKVTGWMKEDYYKKTREIQYKGCKPKIICEKYLEDESGGLVDYKIHCSNGSPQHFEILLNRFTQDKPDYMYKDLKWKELDIDGGDYPKSKINLSKPRKFDEMISVSKKLSKIYPYVRVDLYYVEDRIYFGELTFTPSGGLESFGSIEADLQLGNLIDLSRFNKNRLPVGQKKPTAPSM